MSDRPTPKQIIEADDCLGQGAHLGRLVIVCLEAHGYRIVHPDDVPVGDWIDWSADRNHGWNLCRAHIFGDQP